MESRDETGRDLENSEERLEGLTREVRLLNGDGHRSTASEMEMSLKQLHEENSGLKQHLEDLTSKKQEVETQALGLESDMKALSTRITELQSERDQLYSSSQSKDKQLNSVIEDMEMQCKEFDSKCLAQERDLERLNEELVHLNTMVQESGALRKRIDYLEQTCAEQHRSIEQKDGNIRDLRYRLQNAGQALPPAAPGYRRQIRKRGPPPQRRRPRSPLPVR